MPNNVSMCKCCLEGQSLKELWGQYLTEEGDLEVYGEMLTDCFVLTWMKPDDGDEYICDRCIDRLRDAYQFRRQVLAAKDVLDNNLLDTNKEDVKEEVIVTEYEQKETEDESQDENIKVEMEHMDEDQDQDQDQDDDPDYECEEDAQYLEESENQEVDSEPEMQVEFLEDDEEAKSQLKKRPTGRRPYRQYTPADIKAAVELVLSKKMTRSQAARAYRIPIKTLGNRVRAEENPRKPKEKSEDVEAKKERQTQMRAFIKEIQQILTYTNATPFRTHGGRYYCMYCTCEGPTFPDPDELRTHTRTKHANDRITSVEQFMKPFYQNEILKLDIDKLQCTVCIKPIAGWNEMFTHLKTKHEIVLNQAYTKIVPFTLHEELFCALCKDYFGNFYVLDGHMNAHYTNYMCGECGDTFLTVSRLKKHEEIHSTVKFPCPECGKEFALEKYRSKHYNFVHGRGHKFSCRYCDEKFHGEYPRHLHVVEKHKDKVKTINCKVCSRSFTWRPYYLKHMRIVHPAEENKFPCKMCPKKFVQRHELRNHEEWHRGIGYTCYICDKKFSSKNYLQKHVLTHTKSEYVVIVGDC